MKSMFNSIDLAKKTINLALESELTITQLQLQKVMYYIQGHFMAEFGDKAFDDQIECWSYGPVVRNVWNEFSVYGRRSIVEQDVDIELEPIQKNLIVKILQEKLNMNVWTLVDQTHDEIPWKSANDKGNRFLQDEDMLSQFKSK